MSTPTAKQFFSHVFSIHTRGFVWKRDTPKSSLSFFPRVAMLINLAMKRKLSLPTILLQSDRYSCYGLAYNSHETRWYNPDQTSHYWFVFYHGKTWQNYTNIPTVGFANPRRLCRHPQICCLSWWRGDVSWILPWFHGDFRSTAGNGVSESHIYVKIRLEDHPTTKWTQDPEV